MKKNEMQKKEMTYGQMMLNENYKKQTIYQSITSDAILSIYLQESNKVCDEKISCFDIGVRLANDFHYLNHGEKLLGFLTPDKINESLNSSIEEYQDTDFVPSRI